MKQLHIKVGSTVEIVRPCYLSAKEVNTVECIFDLPEDYDGLIVKAQFTNLKPVIRLVVDGRCTVPPEALVEAGELEIGVIAYAVDGEELVVRHSPTPAHIRVYEGSFNNHAEESCAVSPTVFEQQVSEMKEEATKLATDAANIAKSKVEFQTSINTSAIEQIAEISGANAIKKELEGSEVILTNVKSIEEFRIVGHTTQSVDESGNYVVNGIGKDGTIELSIMDSTKEKIQTYKLPEGIELHGGKITTAYTQWLNENPEEVYEYVLGTATPTDEEIEAFRAEITELESEANTQCYYAANDLFITSSGESEYSGVAIVKNFVKLEITTSFVQQLVDSYELVAYKLVSQNGEVFLMISFYLQQPPFAVDSYGFYQLPQFSNYLPRLNILQIGRTGNYGTGFFLDGGAFSICIAESDLHSFNEDDLIGSFIYYVKEKEDSGNPLTFWYPKETPDITIIDEVSIFDNIQLYPNMVITNNYGAQQYVKYSQNEYKNNIGSLTFSADGVLPTVFTNDELCESQGRKYPPKEGDRLIAADGNAIYRYHEYGGEDGYVRVYAYQPFRGNINIAGEEDMVGELMGNYTGYASGTEPTYGAISPTQHATGDYDYAVKYINNNHFSNENNELFNNSCFKLVAAFNTYLPYNSFASHVTEYLIKNKPSFPKMKVADGQLDDTIFVIKFTAGGYAYAGSYFNVNRIDNGLVIYSGNVKTFEFWHAGCWIDSSMSTYDSYRIPNDYIEKEQDYTIYWAEQSGGEGFSLSSGSSYEFPSSTTFINPNISKGGEWVYEGALAEVAFNMKVEATEDSIATVSGNSNLSYQTLDKYAKPGDIHVKTPSSITGVLTSGLPVWKCKYAKYGKDKQVWERIF